VEGVEFEPGDYPEVWLVRYQGQRCGAVGFAPGDNRWRAAWRGELVGEHYESRDEAAAVLLDLRRRREDARLEAERRGPPAF
jgi:hypothetical protein